MINILCQTHLVQKKRTQIHLGRIMKLSVFLFFCFVFSAVAENANSQNAKITLNKQNATISDILNEIEEQTEYLFLYNKKNVNLNRTATVHVKNKSVATVLSELFEGTNTSFTMEGKHIVLSKNEVSVPQPQQAAGRTITGIVKDEKGESIIGANVVVKGTTNGSITGIDGDFSLTNVPEKATLQISYIGYLTKEVTLGKQGTVNIVLTEDTEVLDEVVVIGYGTAQRKSIVGAVDQVRSKIIEDRPVGNLTQALQGASANLVIQQRSMDPNNNNMNLNIRGISTMNDNSPLVVIDGMITDASAMNNLNPNDIDNVSILKDAGSAAIYGSRSSNGVILVTTKKGKKDMKPTVRFGATLGSQNPTLLATPLKGYQNALLRNDAFVNTGSNPFYSSEQIRQFAEGDSEYFLKGILQNALQQNYNLSLQGGSANTTYMVSAGYYDQGSNFKGPDYGLKRYNFRSNLTTEFGRLKLTALLAYDRDEGRAYQGDTGFLIADASRVPVYNTNVLKDANGRYYTNDVLTGGNPLAALEHGGTTRTDNDHFMGSVNAEFEIMKGLKAKGMFGLDLRPEHRQIRRAYWPVYSSPTDKNPVNSGSNKNYHIEDYSGKATFLNTQFMLDFDRTFNEAHHVTAMAAFSNESYRQERHEIKKQFVDPELYIPITGTIIDDGSYNTPGGTTERSIYSWFGRFGYSFKDKYYGEVNLRYDGTSKFSRKERWGFFPSVSAGWRITEESFMESWKERIGDLKIRGSYGVLGNQNVDDYQYYTTYDIYTNQYGFNNLPVTGTGYTFGNMLLHWESSTTFNIGVDASFFNNALSVSYDYFNKMTSGILMKPEVPGTLGGAVPNDNLGKMRNQGWELTLNYRLNRGEFKHNFGFNLGDSWNEVTKFEGNEQISKSDEIERIIRVGLPLSCYYGYKTDGFFRNEDDIKNSALPIGAKVQPGDVKYVDRNGDGFIDDNDRFILGHAFPRYTFGLTYDVNWKNFDLSVMLQGVGKRDMALRGELLEPFHGSYSFVMFEHQLDYWTPNNMDARWPRLTAPSTTSTANNYGKGSDLQILNAAYLRLKNIQIGYTLPKAWSKYVGAQKIRFYMNGQNLLTFCGNSFIDPESTEFGSRMDAGGANSGRNYPLLKYYGGGIDIVF